MLKSYGFADLEYDIPTPVDASFQIGSVTKQFTTVAILQLAGAGKLSMEDDFTKYVDFDTGDRSISIQRLMDHTSGIKGYTESPEFWGMSVQQLPRDTLLRMMEDKPFDFEPGEAEIYNNTAFFILGLIIEEVSEKSYEDYVEENIFAGVGMDNSYYCDHAPIRKNRARGYGFGEDGLVNAAYLNHTWPYAAGSLCSTAEDLLKWNQALHGGEVLSKELYQSLITPGVLNDGTQLRYCKGIANFEYKGHQIIQHGGGINGFLTESRYFPEEDLVIVVLVNTTGPVAPGDIANQISDQLLDTQEREPVAYEGDINTLSGTYEGASRGQTMTLIVEAKEGLLLVKGEEEEEFSDTLRFYGNGYWSDGSPQRASFVKNQGSPLEMRIDEIYGYYRLNKK